MENNELIAIIIFFLVMALIFMPLLKPFISGMDRINPIVVIKSYIEQTNPSIVYDSGKIAIAVNKQAEAFSFHWSLILAIMETESFFNKHAISSAGARGLMQIYTLECDSVAIEKERLFEIDYNVYCGCCILRDKCIIANYNMNRAIKLYNGTGPLTEIYLSKVLSIQEDIIKFSQEFKSI